MTTKTSATTGSKNSNAETTEVVTDSKPKKTVRKRSTKGRVHLDGGFGIHGIKTGTEGVTLRLKSLEKLSEAFVIEREEVCMRRGFSMDVLSEFKKEIEKEYQQGFRSPEGEGIDMARMRKNVDAGRMAGAVVRLGRYLIGKGYRIYLSDQDKTFGLSYITLYNVQVPCVDKDMLINPCVRINVPVPEARKVIDAVMKQEYIHGLKVQKSHK